MDRECSLCIHSYDTEVTGLTFGGCQLAAIMPTPKGIKNYVVNCKFYKPLTPPKDEDI